MVPLTVVQLLDIKHSQSMPGSVIEIYIEKTISDFRLWIIVGTFAIFFLLTFFILLLIWCKITRHITLLTDYIERPKSNAQKLYNDLKKLNEESIKQEYKNAKSKKKYSAGIDEIN